jgi:hypothetical protein
MGMFEVVHNLVIDKFGAESETLGSSKTESPRTGWPIVAFGAMLWALDLVLRPQGWFIGLADCSFRASCVGPNLLARFGSAAKSVAEIEDEELVRFGFYRYFWFGDCDAHDHVGLPDGVASANCVIAEDSTYLYRHLGRSVSR